jgi:hypothetical protein
MWPRISEFIMGIWLIACPFLMGHTGDPVNLWMRDSFLGAGICLCAILSSFRRFRHVRLATGLLSLLLTLNAFVGSSFGSAAIQNHILLGLTLLMFAIIPNHPNLPPESWRMERR